MTDPQTRKEALLPAGKRASLVQRIEHRFRTGPKVMSERNRSHGKASDTD